MDNLHLTNTSTSTVSTNETLFYVTSGGVELFVILVSCPIGSYRTLL